MSMQQDRHSRVRSWAEWRHGDAVTMAMAFMVELAAGAGGMRHAAFANCGFVGVGGGLWGDFGGMPVFTQQSGLFEGNGAVGRWVDTTGYNKQHTAKANYDSKHQIPNQRSDGWRRAAGGRRGKIQARECQDQEMIETSILVMDKFSFSVHAS